MLQTLKLVRGAVADKDTVPELTHFFIYQGRIQGANSRMAIDAPLPELAGMSLTVPADRFIKAVDLMQSEPAVTVTDTNVIMKHGAFSVRLPILQNDAYPRTTPNPVEWEPDEDELLPLLKRLRPFIATDANQVWPLGVWIDDKGYAYATNNVTMLRDKCGLLVGTGHSINLPAFAIDELLHIAKEPVSFGVTDGAITFYFEDTTWLRTQLISVPWPVQTLDKLYGDSNYKKMAAIPESLASAVAMILPICPNAGFPVVMFKDGAVCTEDGETQATVEGFKLPDAMFNGNILKLVVEYATHLRVDPTRSLFKVNSAEGMFSGLRV